MDRRRRCRWRTAWGLGAWEPALLFLNRAEAGISEPILGLDAGFYLFTLPFLKALHGLLLWVLLVLVVATLVALGLRLRERASASAQAPADAPADDPDGDAVGDRTQQRMALAAGVPSAVLGLLIGTHALLKTFDLLYSQEGVTAGPGWTDVNVRLPAYLLLALLSLALGLAPLIPRLRTWASAWLGGLWKRLSSAGVQPLPPTSLEPVAVTATTAWGLVIALWALFVGRHPSIGLPGAGRRAERDHL
ncbi:UPF0182 family protein [Thiorhodovibrio winogradskyi]|uniref:UPF0182 family protein n=1 Tax=Thiorhodovibrio winogradskyi TaxID=77007 RepID=UPI002E2C4E84|nr:UPF0182 family protein [Thiorhodovibrio winogradskyi]